MKPINQQKNKRFGPRTREEEICKHGANTEDKKSAHEKGRNTQICNHNKRKLE